MGTDPWYFLRAIGLGIIILLTASIPAFALNDPLQWKTVPGPTSTDPILFVWGAVTAATVYRIYATLYKRKNDIDPQDLATMPVHGKTIGTKLWAYLGVFTDQKQKTLEQWKDLLRNDKRITDDAPYTLNNEWREDLTRLLGQVILRFDDLETMHEGHLDTIDNVSTRLRDLMALPDEETLENMLQHTEELLKFAKGIRREFNQWFPEETNTTLENVIKKLEEHFTAATQLRADYDEAQQEIADKDRKLADQMNELGKWETIALLFPGIPKTWKAVSGRVRTLMDQTNVAPLVALFTTPPTDQTIPGIAQNIRNNLNDLETAVQSLCPSEKLSDYQSLEDFIYKTQDFSKRATKYWKHMSGVVGTTTTVTEHDADLLRNTISPKYFPSSGPLNYDQLLAAFAQLNKERLDAITQGKQPAPGPAPCRHPEDLSLILTHDDNQSWDDSIGQVHDLLDQLAQHQQPPPAQGNIDERLFSSSDVPKLGDSDDYWTYRRSFEIFASSAVVAPRQISAAVARILNRFEGHRRSVMMAYDVNANIKVTWTATWNALLTYMDARFLPTNAHQELYVKWITLRRSDSLWGQSFITEFDRIRMTLNQIAPIKGQAPLDDLTTLSRLMDKLPGPVRETFRNKHRDYETRLLATPPTANIYNVYDWIIEDWEYLRNMGMLKDGQGKKADHKKSGPRSSAANPPAAAPQNSQQPLGTSGNRTPLFGHCNKPCFDTAPAISINDRRKASEIFDHLKNANLCFSCRRPAEDHNGPKIGCQLHGSHRNHNASRRAGAPQPDYATDLTSNAASTSGNDLGDN